MYSQLSYFLYIAAMLCCLEDEEFLMKISSRRVGPRHLPVVWCFVLLHRPLGPVISFILRLNVLDTGYTVYFTICHFMCET
jgi:hypothetical protein